MKPGKIRPLAICVFSHAGRILAARGYDPAKKETFYRPLGGGIKFGETSDQTIIRELHEEIRAGVKDLRYLGTLESIFRYNGQQGHEIVLVYDGAFQDDSLYQRETILGCEDDDDGPEFMAVWLSLEVLRQPGAPPLYPSGLLDLLAAQETQAQSE